MDADRRKQTDLSRANIVRAQVIFLCSTLNDDNWEDKLQELKKLEEEAGVEAYITKIRKFIEIAATRIFQGRNGPSDPTGLIFRLLSDEIKSIANKPTLSYRFRDMLNSEQPALFKNFDFERFCEQMALDGLEKSTLALSLLDSPKSDLQQKGVDMLAENFMDVLEILADPTRHPKIEDDELSSFLDQFLVKHKHTFNILNTAQEAAVCAAIKRRFANTPPPPKTRDLVNKLDQQRTSEEDKKASFLDLFRRAGWAATTSMDAVKDMYRRKGVGGPSGGTLTEADVMAVLRLMSSTFSDFDARQEQSWNAENFGKVTAQLMPNLDWNAILVELGRSNFHFPDLERFNFLLNVYRAAGKTSAFDLKTLLEWEDFTARYSAVRILIRVSKDIFDVLQQSEGLVLSVNDFAASGPLVKEKAQYLATQNLNSLDLCHAFFQLNNFGEDPQAIALLREEFRNNVELLTLAGSILPVHCGQEYLTDEQEPWSAATETYVFSGFQYFFRAQGAHQLFFTRAYQSNPTFVTKLFLQYFTQDPQTVSRICDIAQEVKILPQLLRLRPYTFALELAALASRREFLNLAKWLDEMIEAGGPDFFRQCLEFLHTKASQELQAMELNRANKDRPQFVGLKITTVVTFLRTLVAYRQNNDTLTPELKQMLDQVQTNCVRAYPYLVYLDNDNDEFFESLRDATALSPEAEARIGQLFQQLYSKSLSVETVINSMQQYKTSPDPVLRELFAGFVHSLIDEYRFYAHDYPTPALGVTAVLFGSIISYGFVSSIPLSICLKYVQEALRDEPGSKMFSFGVQALSLFTHKAKDWPQFFTRVLQNQNFVNTQPEIADEIRSLLGGEGNRLSLSPQQTYASTVGFTEPATEQPTFTAVKVIAERPDGLQFLEPTETVRDKMLFVINNLTKSNLESKLQSLRGDLTRDVYAWFAHYLVTKRAMVEVNNHELYVTLLDLLNNKELIRQVHYETYSAVVQLINSETALTDFAERGTLKTLAGWLGGLTLAKNKPILHDNISFKDLLLQGYDSARLIVVIPFVCRILEQCGQSTVFTAQNAWVNGILRLLSEFYFCTELKLSLKFEIEIACRKLGVQIGDINPSNMLKEREERQRLEKEAMEQAASRALRDDRESIERYNDSIYDQQQQQLQIQQLQQLQDSQINSRSAGTLLNSMLNTVSQTLNVSPTTQLFGTHHGLRQILVVAIQNAIREVYPTIAQRASDIAVTASREVVGKDFATEIDEGKLRKSSNIMVKALAGPLAQTTCRDPMKASMLTHLRSLMLQNGYHEEQIPENEILQVVNDNLDMACGMVEKLASDRAFGSMNEQIETAVLLRKKFRNSRPGQAFIDPEIGSRLGLSSGLPEPLRLKAGGLTAQQMKVYDDFAHIPKNPTQAAALYARDERVQPLVADARAEGPFPPAIQQEPSAPVRPTQAPAAPGPPSFPEALREKILSTLTQLETEIRKGEFTSYSSVPQDHFIRTTAKSLYEDFSKLPPPQRDEASILAASKVVQMLYTNAESPFARDTFVTIVTRLCDLSPRTMKELSIWLLFGEDEVSQSECLSDIQQKYNVPVTISLIQAGILNTSELDERLSRSMREGNKLATLFTANLIRDAVLTPNPAAERGDFQSCLHVIDSMIREVSPLVPKTVRKLWRDLREEKHDPEEIDELSEDELQLNEAYVKVFAEWVTLVSNSSMRRAHKIAFIHQMYTQGILGDDITSTAFYRVNLQMAIGSYYKFGPAAQSSDVYRVIDALAYLFVSVIELNGDDEDGQDARVLYLTKLLSLVLLVFTDMNEELAEQFQQKPFFRLFSMMLTYLLRDNEETFSPIEFEILAVFGEAFSVLQPNYFPDFTFSWWALVSHQCFMPRLLLLPDKKGWPVFTRLLASMFKFMEPRLRDGSITPTVDALTKGLLRTLLVLLHDFPDYLSENHFTLCNLIPPGCVQLKNLVLSAFPRMKRLPDPFMQGLILENIIENKDPPRLSINLAAVLDSLRIRAPLDKYLQIGAPADFPRKLVDRIKLVPMENGLHNGTGPVKEKRPQYNVDLLNAIVLYVGMQAIDLAQKNEETGVLIFDPTSPQMGLFTALNAELDIEGRYHFLSAIANQLRYPNSHTYYFSCAILELFSQEDSPNNPHQQITYEQITRVLLERIVCNRPHPWGLLITFTSLLKHDRYRFWSMPFVKKAPEIERLFYTLFKHISGNVDRETA